MHSFEAGDWVSSKRWHEAAICLHIDSNASNAAVTQVGNKFKICAKSIYLVLGVEIDWFFIH